MCHIHAMGRPKQPFQPNLSGIGITIGKFVRRHMHVSTYELSLQPDGVKGPIQS